MQHMEAVVMAGAWLSAPPISSLGLMMEDDAVHMRIAVGL